VDQTTTTRTTRRAPRVKGKRHERVDLRASSGKSDTTNRGKQPQKRKATADIDENSRPFAPSALVHAAPALIIQGGCTVRCTTSGNNGVKVVLYCNNFDAMKCWDAQRYVPNHQNQKKNF
jgi:hypothetical protein